MPSASGQLAEGDSTSSHPKRSSLLKRDEHDALVSRLSEHPNDYPRQDRYTDSNPFNLFQWLDGVEFLEDLVLNGHDPGRAASSSSEHAFGPGLESRRGLDHYKTTPPDMSHATPRQLVDWYLREEETLARLAATATLPSSSASSHEDETRPQPGRNVDAEHPLPNGMNSQARLGKRKASLEPPDHQELSKVTLTHEEIREIVHFYLSRVNGHLPALHAARLVQQVDVYLANGPVNGFRDGLEPGSTANDVRGKTRLVIDAIVAFVVVNDTQSVVLSPHRIEAIGGFRNLWIRTCNTTLLEAWSRPSLEVVQALLILAFASITASWSNLKHWNVIGTAARLSVLIGLNREYGIENTATPSFQQETLPSNYLPPPGDPVEAELRRRVFWSIFLVDRIGASATGWTFSLNRRDHGVDLPGSDDWDAASPLGVSGPSDSGEPSMSRGRRPRVQSSFRFPPAGRVAQEIEAPNPEFRWSAAVLQDEQVDDRTPLSLLMEAAEGLGHVRAMTRLIAKQPELTRSDELPQVQVFLAEPISPVSADTQVLALMQLDRRLETWYDQIPDQYRIDRAPPSSPEGLSPNAVLMLGVYHIAVIMLHQPVAYAVPDHSNLGYPNAIRRCRDAYVTLIRILKSLSPGQVNRLHPLSSYWIYVLGRALCLHSKYRMTVAPREINSHDDQLEAGFGLCLDVLDQVGTSWGCAKPMADGLRRGLDAIQTPEMAQAFYDPRAVPLAWIKAWNLRGTGDVR